MQSFFFCRTQMHEPHPSIVTRQSKHSFSTQSGQERFVAELDVDDDARIKTLFDPGTADRGQGNKYKIRIFHHIFVV